MKSKRRKDIVRVGDQVKILVPNVFIRCGYPLSKQIIIDTMITAEQKLAVKELLQTFDFLPSKNEYLDLNVTNADVPNTLSLKILDVLASALLVRHSWGGTERKIYTEYRPSLLNQTVQVIGKRIVQTGTYKPAHTYQGYYDLYPEYEPAYLQNLKSNVILELDISPEDLTTYRNVEIERCNVELVKELNYGN